MDKIAISLNAKMEITYPNGGQTLTMGDRETITWKGTAGAEKYKLFWTIDNGLTWKAITTDYITGTSYDWTVPAYGVKKTAKIKVIGYTGVNVAAGSDLSNAGFAIVRTPATEVSDAVHER